jgi:hypothetical protein
VVAAQSWPQTYLNQEIRLGGVSCGPCQTPLNFVTPHRLGVVSVASAHDALDRFRLSQARSPEKVPERVPPVALG